MLQFILNLECFHKAAAKTGDIKATRCHQPYKKTCKFFDYYRNRFVNKQYFYNYDNFKNFFPTNPKIV